MGDNDYVTNPQWRNYAWERECMASQDFMAYPHLYRLRRLPFHSACGISCEICGSTFLQRDLNHISSYARKQGAMEDPYSWDRILPQGRGLRQEQLRPNIKCTLCFEAHCSQCHEVLHITDYLWDDRCCHCGKPSNPYFIQLKAIRPKFIEKSNQGFFTIVSDEFGDSQGSRRMQFIHERFGLTSEEVAYQFFIHFQCSCCGARSPDSGQFRYLNRQPWDSQFFTVPFWTVGPCFKSRPCRREGWKCRLCREGAAAYT